MTPDQPSNPTAASRRAFLKSTAAAALASGALPTILRAEDKAGSKLPVLGSGEHTYEAIHGWGELPAEVVWGETHGVTVDENGLIYIKHRTMGAEPMDSIVVFDPEGKCVRSFGKEYSGGGHGIDIRKEDGQEYLYLCDVKNRLVAKSTLTGEQLWKMHYPEEAGVYTDLKQFNPTNVAFAPDGGFYVADGYGSSYIHQYDKDAKWVRTWGGVGTEEGKMRTPHGIWLDNRPGREPTLVVADRANARLQYFTLDGKFIKIIDGVSFPAHFDLRGTDLLGARPPRPRHDHGRRQPGDHPPRLRPILDRPGTRTAASSPCATTPTNGNPAASSTPTTPATTPRGISSWWNGCRRAG